ncbi:hypothetical protein D018_4174B, partial [Vibrio parahaemolyticus VP2007-007]
EDTACQHP